MGEIEAGQLDELPFGADALEEHDQSGSRKKTTGSIEGRPQSA